ncbi:helix-turn-helix domain-containing protein [Opitutus sp. ER46]|uniref:helix-turn-helix domain-containing protein n=1 Tax=Opitutus sp. ER46 TaxID=2161864 RepID=UPI0011B23566|nr:helix-turn-helix domain-containing protein [Opitutus sp. ER46]
MFPLSQLIRDHRRKAGLAQAELAQLAGVGKTVVWDVEHGKESIQWDTLQKLFRVLNISVVWHSPLLDRAAASSPAASSTQASSSHITPAPASPSPSPSGSRGRRKPSRSP